MQIIADLRFRCVVFTFYKVRWPLQPSFWLPTRLAQ